MDTSIILIIAEIIAAAVGGLVLNSSGGGRKKRVYPSKAKPKDVPARGPRCVQVCDYCAANSAQKCYKGEGHSGSHACPTHMTKDMEEGEV